MAKLTKAQLQAQAQSLGLSTGGTVADLQNRISAAEEALNDTANAVQDKPDFSVLHEEFPASEVPGFDELFDDATPKAHHAVTKPAAIGAALFSALFG